MARERVAYRETYRKGALVLNAESLPVLRHQATDGSRFRAIECEVIAAGEIERDGERIEFQDLRVYVERE